MPQQRGAIPEPWPDDAMPWGQQLSPVQGPIIPQPQAPPGSQSPSLAERIGTGIQQRGIGVMKGVAQTASDVQQKMRSMDRPRYSAAARVATPEPTPPPPGGLTIPPAWYEAQNEAQGAGKVYERIGEYILGGMGAGRTGGGLGTQMVRQGLTTSGISGVHGATPQEAAGAGVMSALGTGIAGKAMGLLQRSPLGQAYSWMRGRGGGTPGATQPVNAEFVDTSVDDVMDVPFRTVTTPPGQVGPYVQPKIGGTAPPQGQLPPPAPTQPLFYGQEGGLGAQRVSDVVAQHPKPVVPPKGGPARPETPLQMRERLINFGRGVTKQPTAEAASFKSPGSVELPSGEFHVPSSREIGQGFVLYRNKLGQWAKHELTGAHKPVAAPKPPPTPTRRASDRVTELMKEEAQATTPATGESVMKGGGLNKPSQAIQKARDEAEAEYLKSQLVDRRAPVAAPKKPPKGKK